MRGQADSRWRRSFYAFSVSQGVAQFAAQGLLTAVPLIALVDLHANASTAGLLAAGQYLPVLLVTPIVGTLVDSWRKRPLMVVVHLMRFVIFGVLAVIGYFGELGTGGLILAIVVAGSISACFDVAVQAYLPAVVPRDGLLGSNALVQGIQSMAQVIGPAIGGLVAGLASPAAGFGTFAILYLLSALILVRARARETRIERSSESFWKRTVEGFAFCMKSPTLRIFLFTGAWFNLFERAMLTIYLVFAATILKLPSWEIGLTTALGALGAVCGAALSRRFGGARHRFTLLIVSMGFASAAPVGLVFVPRDGFFTVVVASTIFFAYGMGLTTYNVQAVSIRQVLAPLGLQGRVAGVYRFFAYGAIGVGGLAAAALLAYISPVTGLAIVTGLLVIGWLLFGAKMLKLGANALEVGVVETLQDGIAGTAGAVDRST